LDEVHKPTDNNSLHILLPPAVIHTSQAERHNMLERTTFSLMESSALLLFLIQPYTTYFPCHLRSIRRRLVVSRILLQIPRINRRQFRARQLRHQVTDRARQQVQWPEEDIWFRLRSDLVDEATEVVALKKGCRVEDPAGEVLDVDAGEGVGCAGVAA
jgi:hypothetical protein